MTVQQFGKRLARYPKPCGGGGYAINASMTERRIKAVATITGANYGRVMREGVLANGDPVAFLEDIARQRTAEARGAALRVDVGLYPSVEAAQKDGADFRATVPPHKPVAGMRAAEQRLVAFLS